MQRKLFIFLIITLFLIVVSPNVLGIKKQGKTVLLAVSEHPEGLEGAAAELELELIKGEGRVFLETYPLTKADTQISMRFAKQVACNIFNLDCDNYDFIFTIRAHTGIIGGPSAGASAAALIVSMFKDIKLSDSISVTGTINSGAIIGGVGGLDKKIMVANSSGINKVLIPTGKRFVKVDNQDVDLIELGKNHGIQVKEVTTLHEVLNEFSDYTFKEEDFEIEMNKEYEIIMSSLANSLCLRTELLKEQFEKIKPKKTRRKFAGNRKKFKRVYRKGKKSK